MKIKNYLKNEKCIFAFNIWDINSAKAVIDAASEQEISIILQTSSSVYEKMPKVQLRDFVSSYAEEKKVKAWLHLDHCKNIELIKEAILYNWDSVMIDASDKDIDENIRLTNTITEYAHKRNVLVEAEVGQVKGVEDDIYVRDDKIASRQEISKFLKETDVDMIAVAFGNAHGVYTGTPKLNYDLIEYTVSRADIPFVVHGGSGLDDTTIEKLISIHNVKKINISTDIKLAYRNGIMQAYDSGLFEESGFQSVIIEKYIQDSIKSVVKSKLELLK